LVQEAWDEHLPDADPKNKNRKTTDGSKGLWVWYINGPQWFEYYPRYPSKHFIVMIKTQISGNVENILAGKKPVQDFLDKTEGDIQTNKAI